ncbi:MAG: DUF6017 domain-containing protein [Lachnospiraceae bacterium]
MEEDTGGHTVMEEGLKFDYYYGVQSEQFSFYRIPRLLIKDQHFKGLSSDAKLLYGLMLDRMALSMKNHWLDNENRAYIIYSISNVMDDINCSKPTCVKIMKELDSFGLIERKRKGLGKPDIIYVKNFAVLEDSQEQDEESSDSADTFEENKPVMSNENITSEGKQDELPEVKDFNFNNEAYGLEMVETEEIFKEKEQISPNVGVNSGISKKSELPEVKDFNFWNEKTLTSGGKESLPLEVKNLAPNYNNNNYDNQSYNYIIQSYQSNLSSQADQACKDEIDTIGNTDAYIQQIKKNLDYDFYMTNDVAYMDKDLLKELFVIICDVVCTKSETIKISGYVYSCDYVRSKFLRLTSNHVMYVMDCIKNTTTKIANIKAYLLVALFNAPSTIDHYYQQEVRHYADSDAQEVC